MTFTPNPAGIAALARAPQMNRYLGAVADGAAAAVSSAAPSIVRHQGARIYGAAQGGTGRVVVDSPFWHLPEYGATRYPMAPFIRPTVAAYLARVGGRLGGR